MYQSPIDQFENAQPLDSSLVEEVTSLKQTIRELKAQIRPELSEIADGFEYLLKLAEEDLYLQSSEDIIPFWSQLVDLCDQFLDAQGPVEKINQYFKSELKHCFDQLPKHLKQRHDQNLEDINGLNLAPEIKKAAISFPTRIAAVVVLSAALSGEAQAPSKSETGSSIKDLTNITQISQTAAASPEPLVIKGQIVRMPKTVAIPTPSPKALNQTSPEQVYSSAVLNFVEREKSGMDQRFDFVLKKPERADILADIQTNSKIPDASKRDRVALIAILESNVDQNAVSGVGAMGIFQDMGKLQGAFGDPRTIAQLMKTPGLMPSIGDEGYTQAKSKGVFALLKFLKTEKKNHSSFWQRFIKTQKAIITDPQKSQLVANFYLESLEGQARKISSQEASDLDTRNLGIMAYNMGMGNMFRLKRAMKIAGITRVDTESVIKFIERADMRTVLHKALSQEKGYSQRSKNGKTQMLSAIFHKFQEGQGYITRYIALEQNLANQRQPIEMAKAA